MQHEKNQAQLTLGVSLLGKTAEGLLQYQILTENNVGDVNQEDLKAFVNYIDFAEPQKLLQIMLKLVFGKMVSNGNAPQFTYEELEELELTFNFLSSLNTSRYEHLKDAYNSLLEDSYGKD